MPAGKVSKMSLRKRLFTTASKFVGKRDLAYPAAGNGPRSAGWGSSTTGPNSALNNALDTLRRRARQEVRTNTWAAAGIDTIVINVVGSGIRPMHKNSDIVEKWVAWSHECDAHSYTNFAGLQALVMRSVAEAGECFVRIRPRRPTDGLTVPLQLEVMEAEMVPASMSRTLANGNEIVAGIEFNKIGARVAYHVYKTHPGDGVAFSLTDTVRVPANRILHVRLIHRPGAVRAEPWLTKALVKLKDLDAYDDATLVKAKVSALFGGFIHAPGNSDEDDEVIAGLTPERHPDDDDVVIDPLEPGSFPVLPPGYDVKFSNPPDVGSTYAVFMQTQLRSIATSLGITYEQLTGDFSGVNDRIIRASLLEFKRRARMWQQQLLVHQFCRPVWQQFMNLGLLAGEFSTRDEGFETDPEWIPEAWEYLNPSQEIDALRKEVEGGFASRSEVIQSRAKDPVAVDEQIAKDNERADGLGLMHTSDGRYSKFEDIGAPSDGETLDENEGN
ncbi:phage portal protein [Sulfitobacter sp. M22]|uniref:phage portal protein n=1 Tax=Sulfitobacter sp. M22 TaxID=2675332 RepID=UPI0030185513